jgi:hypothetical protein
MRDVFQAKLDHLNTMDTFNMMRNGTGRPAASAPAAVGLKKSGGWAVALAGLAALAVAVIAGASDKGTKDTGPTGS